MSVFFLWVCRPAMDIGPSCPVLSLTQCGECCLFTSGPQRLEALRAVTLLSPLRDPSSTPGLGPAQRRWGADCPSVGTAGSTTCTGVCLGALYQLLKGLEGLFEISSPAWVLNFELGQFIQHAFIPRTPVEPRQGTSVDGTTARPLRAHLLGRWQPVNSDHVRQ